MTDRELLELAAKAAYGDFGGQMVSSGWNPLEDDGEALRLAVTMSISVCQEPDAAWATSSAGRYGVECFGDYRTAATRRAITMASAGVLSADHA